MKTLTAIFTIMLTACATPHSGPTADIGSTFIAMSGGSVQELSPIADVVGLAGGAAISLALRAAIIRNSRGTPECESVAGWTSAVGWGATCNNLAAALGAAPLVSIGLLVFCSITLRTKQANETQAWCSGHALTDMPCTLDNLPPDLASASCIDGRLAFK